MKLGLIGKKLAHSASQAYFEKKFLNLGLRQASYTNYEVARKEDLPEFLARHANCDGLNVTLPYKEAIIPYLSKMSNAAAQIGAVNVLKKIEQGWEGFNTDWFAFQKCIEPLLETHQQRALILGTGGAAKAVAYALEQMGMPYLLVSRQVGRDLVPYERASELLEDHFVLINATPVGMHPQEEEMPPLDLAQVGSGHLVYDLIYNPGETTLMRTAREQGAKTANGQQMLELQAEEAWQIWNRL